MVECLPEEQVVGGSSPSRSANGSHYTKLGSEQARYSLIGKASGFQPEDAVRTRYVAQKYSNPSNFSFVWKYLYVWKMKQNIALSVN